MAELDTVPSPCPANITGLVLSGGEGRRMGGLDKGLQTLQGRALIDVTLARLRPQVSSILISANRHIDQYAQRGWPVVPDEPLSGGEPYAGPLAGMLSGLRRCPTPWLLCVPCDSPYLPADLTARLAAGLQAQGADLAIACTAATASEPARRHPVFALMSTRLAPSLAAFLASGQRKLDHWGAQQRRALVTFDDASAFANLNTLADLATDPDTPPQRG